VTGRIPAIDKSKGEIKRTRLHGEERPVSGTATGGTYSVPTITFLSYTVSP
jgi:hypothetical protein